MSNQERNCTGRLLEDKGDKFNTQNEKKQNNQCLKQSKPKEPLSEKVLGRHRCINDNESGQRP